ncbi:hypothetical protein UFOVP477_20 [uncultured Caudovirales phage]|uniref:Uncharacterized protein n=1 Tax=uncultured Caudovirales phage TaxID=2100421 RepID=A0A6J5NWN2_9CAUD|nr:hypothetical protein UFOVP477_20 [uncultured Caudovirales phage]CAB4163427.1 hypothetical protein UFOVP798_24 [uncultured Caudovirales phage]CAB4191060.1 hypothetical protein UFOVP1222_3 [uncultured Caudovirales phage]
MKKYIQNYLAQFIFGEDLNSVKMGIKIAQMPIKAEDTTTEEPSSDVTETLHDHESRIGTCEDHEYSIDELRSEIEEIKSLAEATEVSIDELREATTIDFPEEFTKALAQPEFITLIETIIKNEREKQAKKKKKATTKKKA